jgi:hypothetical protein
VAYVTLAELKTYLGIVDTSDDALLTAMLSAAHDAVDAHCGRWFEGRTATRVYGPGDVTRQILRLDAELLSVTTLTNGDGSVIATANVVLWPRNSLPAWAIRLKSTLLWTFADADSEISVVGSWGYAATPPAAIIQATKRVAGWLYRGKDAQVFDVSGHQAFGQVTISRELPGDVRALLTPYRRRTT